LTRDFWAKNGKKNAKAKTTAIAQSLRPSGFAPAFGRAVGLFGPACFGTAEAVPLSKAIRGESNSWIPFGMTNKKGKSNGKKQIPFGDDNKKGKSNGNGNGKSKATAKATATATSRFFLLSS
jgi:hypothetical protein